MKADIIIIGSGISGLTAAAILAKQNKKVVVLESHPRPGGALKRFKRQGISYDIGFHYTGCLGQGEILNALWNYIGILPKIEILPFPDEGCDLLRIKKTDHQIHSYFSYAKLVDSLCESFPNEKKAIHEYIHTLKSICHSIPFYNLDLPLKPFLERFFNQGVNLEKFLSSITQDSSLQAVLASPVFLHGVPPHNVGQVVHASIAHAFHAGAYAIKGGGQSIVNAFLDVLAKYDVTILTGSEVQSIQVENEEVKGVKIADQTIKASTVIYTGHPTKLLELTPDKIFRPAYNYRLQNLINTGSMFVVFGKTNNYELAKKLQWTNYLSVPQGLNLLNVDTEKQENNSVLITAPGLRDYGYNLPNSGPFPVILMRPAKWEEVAPFFDNKIAGRPSEYKEWKEKNCFQLINQVNEQFGFSSDSIFSVETGSPLTFHDELKMPEGSIYGPQFRIGQYNPGARTKIHGLYLGGQGTLMPGVVGASLSGLIAAGKIGEIEPLWNKIRECQ